MRFQLPPLRSAADAVSAIEALADRVAGGEVTPREAAELGKLVKTYIRAIETHDFDQRLQAIEKNDATRS